jgi:serine/threonine protein kinase
MFQKQKIVTKNNVVKRLLPLNKSVELGLESEQKISDFKILKELGTGSFGKVFLVQHKKTNVLYALKVIDKRKILNEQERDDLIREVEIMYKIHHPNIVKLFGHFEDNIYCYLVMEYIEGGELFSYIPEEGKSKLSTQQIASLIRDVISAIYYLHNMNPQIIHRDIKPENILINSNMKAKITDFGWSTYIKPGDIRNSVCGTPIYMAPEMINKKGYNEKVDIWCIGVLLFELLTGDQAWAGENIETVKYNICHLRISWPENMNSYAEDLISKILKSNPEERISLKDMLNHPFFTQYFANPTSCLIAPDSKKYKVFIISKDDPLIWNPLLNEGNHGQKQQSQQQKQLKANPIHKKNNSYIPQNYKQKQNNDNYVYENYNNYQNEYEQLQNPEFISASFNYFKGNTKPKIEVEKVNWTSNKSNKNNEKNFYANNNENGLIWGTTYNNSNQYQPYEINYDYSNNQTYLNNVLNNNKSFTGVTKIIPQNNNNNNNQFGMNYDFNIVNNYQSNYEFKEKNAKKEEIEKKRKEEELLINSYFNNNNQFESIITCDQNTNLDDFAEYLF